MLIFDSAYPTFCDECQTPLRNDKELTCPNCGLVHAKTYSDVYKTGDGAKHLIGSTVQPNFLLTIKRLKHVHSNYPANEQRTMDLFSEVLNKLELTANKQLKNRTIYLWHKYCSEIAKKKEIYHKHAVMALALIIAIKEDGKIIITRKEVIKAFDSRGIVNTTLNRLILQLNIKPKQVDIKTIISFLIDKLRQDEEGRKKIEKLGLNYEDLIIKIRALALNKLKEIKALGTNPHSSAIAAIYYSGQFLLRGKHGLKSPLSKKLIAKLFNISENSLTWYKQYFEFKEEDIQIIYNEKIDCVNLLRRYILRIKKNPLGLNSSVKELRAELEFFQKLYITQKEE